MWISDENQLFYDKQLEMIEQNVNYSVEHVNLKRNYCTDKQHRIGNAIKLC